jgi:hypothetical protein
MTDYPASDPSARPLSAPPSALPARPASLLPTDPSDPLYAAYRDPNHAAHESAVTAVHARFQASTGGPEPWRDDGLERPSPSEPRAPWALLSPKPHTPLPDDTLRAVANVFAPIVGGRKDVAQAALDYLEGGPADRLPALPPDYVPPDPNASLAELRAGWGPAKLDENLRLARGGRRV